MNLIQAPQDHLSIVARATEPRRATTAFAQQARSKHKCRLNSKGGSRRPSAGKTHGTRARDSQGSFLKIEQVKVNAQDVTLRQEPLNESQKSGLAIGT